jgi:hypothetical protein
VGAALWHAVLEVCTPDRVKGVMVQTDDSDTEIVDVALAHFFRNAADGGEPMPHDVLRAVMKEPNDAILASNRTLGFVPSVGLRDLTFDY